LLLVELLKQNAEVGSMAVYAPGRRAASLTPHVGSDIEPTSPALRKPDTGGANLSERGQLPAADPREIHEDWIEATKYLNMELLREQQKQDGSSARPPELC
jgi:hypothetical protein